MKPLLSTPEHKIVSAGQLHQLLSAAPDQELVLTAELVFHQFIYPAHLWRLRAENFVVQDGQPVAIWHSNGLGMSGNANEGYYTDIQPAHQPLVRLLLPRSGCLFSAADPFARLQHYAARLGLRLRRRDVRKTCILNALAIGMDIAKVACLARLSPVSMVRCLNNPISHSEALTYWQPIQDLERVADLPRYCGRHISRGQIHSAIRQLFLKTRGQQLPASALSIWQRMVAGESNFEESEFACFGRGEMTLAYRLAVRRNHLISQQPASRNLNV